MSIRQAVRRWQRSIVDYFKTTQMELKDTVITPPSTEPDSQILNQSLVIASGLERDLQNPDKLLNDKGKTLAIYDTMIHQDDRMRMAYDLKKSLVLSTDWKIQPASNEQSDRDIADEVWENFDRLKSPTFPEVLENLCESFIYGFKIGEIIWKELDGLLVWARVKFQHSILFDFHKDQYGNLESVVYGNGYGIGKPIPVEQFQRDFLCVVYPALVNDNWYGRSDFVELYFDWWSKYNIKRWRNEVIQGYGRPVPIVVYDSTGPNKLSTTEKNELKETFETWQDSMYLLVPGTRDATTKELRAKFEVTFQEFKAENTDIHQRTIDAIDNSITRKILLPDKLGFTTDSTGSFAQSKQIFDMMIKSIKRIHRLFEGVLNEKIKQFVDINFGEQEQYPHFAFDQIDKGIEYNMLNTLINAGVIDKREQWIRSYVNIPDLTTEEKNAIEQAKAEDKKNNPPPPPTPFMPDPNKDPNKNGDPNNKSEFKRAEMPWNYKKTQEQYDTYEADFLADYNRIMADQENRLIDTIVRRNVVEDKNFGELNRLKMQKGELKDLFSRYYAKLYLTGKVSAIETIKDRLPVKLKGEYIQFQIENVEDEWLDREWIDRYLKKYGELGTLTAEDRKFLKDLRDRAFYVTGVEEKRTLDKLQSIIQEGSRSGVEAKTIIAQLRSELPAERQQYAQTIARTNASDAYNTGWMNLYTEPTVTKFIEAYQFSAIVDDVTTPFCKAHDGQVIYASDPELAKINPPCHYNCRSILIPIMVGDNELDGGYYQNYQDELPEWNTGVPKDLMNPAKGFGGTK